MGALQAGERAARSRGSAECSADLPAIRDVSVNKNLTIAGKGWLTMNNVAVSHNNGRFGFLNHGFGIAFVLNGAFEYRPPVRMDFRQGTVVWQEEGRYR